MNEKKRKREEIKNSQCIHIRMIIDRKSIGQKTNVMKVIVSVFMNTCIGKSVIIIKEKRETKSKIIEIPLFDLNSSPLHILTIKASEYC
jgi:hypothetical protein